MEPKNSFRDGKPKRYHVFAVLFLLALGLAVLQFPAYQYATSLVASNKYHGHLSNSGSVQKVAEKPTLVLMWTKYFEEKGEDLLKFIYSGRKCDPSCCSDTNRVKISVDKNLLDEADVIIIHSRDLAMPPRRSPSQIWILLATESPVHTPRLHQYDGLFNWTMTYRLDSDIIYPYGKFVEVENSQVNNWNDDSFLDQWISQKSKFMAAAVSNCHTFSQREKILDAMINSSLSVDIYGACGTICKSASVNCKRDASFWKEIAGQYKFFFAAENSLCEDYVTEKLWRTLALGMVPVVYGGANYSNIAPPNSIIDVKDYATLEALHEYLHEVDKNDSLYKEYFIWRKKYRIMKDGCWMGWCNMCEKLTNFSSSSVNSQIYKHIHHWWYNVPGLYKDTDKPACSNSSQFLTDWLPARN